MDGTNFTRCTKLFQSFVIQPGDTFRYLKYLSEVNKSTLNISLPWISFGAIDFLDEYLKHKNCKVLELGGGGSTLFFAKRAESVTCLESDENWFSDISVYIKNLGVTNTSIICKTYDKYDPEGFERSLFFKELEELDSQLYDIIFIDNMDENDFYRPKCFGVLEKKIKKGGIIIVDDSWRYKGLRKVSLAKSYSVFESKGPARIGVTSTDVYFY